MNTEEKAAREIERLRGFLRALMNTIRAEEAAGNDVPLSISCGVDLLEEGLLQLQEEVE